MVAMLSLSERVEALREAVVNAARDEQLATMESAGAYRGDFLEWDRDLTRYGPSAGVLRAIVSELGVTREMVGRLGHMEDPADLAYLAPIYDALTTLLDALNTETHDG